MLKNIKIYTLLFITLSFMACSTDNEVDPLFDQDANTRVDEQLKSYKKTLVDSEFGWKTVYQPDNSIGAYNVYLKFNADNTVDITSDYKGGIDDLETTFRVGLGHFPELVLENYSTFHSMFETNNFSLGAEFEFLFEEVSAESIKFRSKTDVGNVSEIVFERATAADKQSVENLRGLYDRLENGYETASFLRNLVVLNGSNEIVFNSTFTYYDTAFRRGSVSVFNQETGALTTTIHPIAATEAGFDLLLPLSVNGVEISKFIFDEVNNIYTSTDGGLTTIIGYDLAPIATDFTPALFSDEVNIFGQEFTFYSYFDNNASFFLTETSEDFLNLGLASSFNRLDIIFDDEANGGISYFQFRMNDGSSIFVLFDDVTITGERMIFNFSNVFGDPTPILGMLNILLDPDGFYIQRTEESQFIFNPSFLLTSAAYPNFRFSLYGI